MLSKEIRIGDLDNDKPLDAAKWLQIPLLLDLTEMRDLLSLLEPYWILIAGRILEKGKAIISTKDFLAGYADYIDTISKGKKPDMKRFRPFFSVILTKDLNAVYRSCLSDTEEIIKPCQPIIQLQAHTLTFSKEEGKFRSMLFGSKSFSWGILFSYPQIMQDHQTKDIIRVDTSDQFPNTKAFKMIMRWQRKNTVPTPFLYQEKRIISSARIGKNCFSWINHHPDLQFGITVDVKRNLAS